MKHLRLTAFAFATAGLFTLSACSTAADAPDATSAPPAPATDALAPLTLSSGDFSDGGAIPDEMTAAAFGGTCEGANLSPSLEWQGGPSETSTYAIVMLDSSHEDWVHWLLADIPAQTTTLSSGADLQEIGAMGRNGMGNANYFGPCPMSPDHLYTIELWALDAELGLESGFSHEELVAAADGHVLDTSLISGTRSGER